MNKDKSSRIIRFLAIIAVLGISSSAYAQRVNHTVDLRLDEAQTMLEAETRGSCSRNNHPGCIAVARGTQGRLNFNLTGNKVCQMQSGASWEVGEVYLGGKNSESKPGSWGGFGNDAEVQADFNFSDPATGELVAEAGSNENSFVILDENLSEGGYDIWYTVTAHCVDGGGNILATVELDPRIENGGTQ